MIQYIQEENKRDNLKNIVYFIADYFKEDKGWKEIVV